MNIENTNTELDEQIDLTVDEQKNTLVEDDEFKKMVYSRMRGVHNQGMVVGFKTSCHTILDKIYAFERKPGSKSTNDYKRLVKEIKRFCEVGISREVSASEAEPTENSAIKTAQN